MITVKFNGAAFGVNFIDAFTAVIYAVVKWNNALCMVLIRAYRGRHSNINKIKF
jgi:hypothetical protein